MLKLEIYWRTQLPRDTFEWVQSHRPHRGQAAGDDAQNGDIEALPAPAGPSASSQKGSVCPVPFQYQKSSFLVHLIL